MKPDITLYLVTDSTGMTGQAFLDRIHNALKGGVTLIQLREKERTARDFLSLAVRVRELADSFNVPLIINDRADIALACGAGVHGGADVIPTAALRRIMGEKSIIGATAKTLEQAKKAQSEGADYLGVGAIFPTSTKVTARTSIEDLKKICREVNIPVCAIGGITEDNCTLLKGSGIKGIAVVSAVMSADDPFGAASRLLEKAREIVS